LFLCELSLGSQQSHVKRRGTGINKHENTHDDTVGMKGGPPNNAEVGPGVGAAVGECIGIEVGSPPANVGMFELVKGPLSLVRLAVGVNVGMHVGLVVGLDD